MAVFLPKDWRATALAAPGSRSTTLVQKKLPKNWKALTLADWMQMAESGGSGTTTFVQKKLPKNWKALATALAARGSCSTTFVQKKLPKDWKAVQKKLPKNWKAMTLADCRKMAESEGTADVDEGMAGLRIADNGVTLV